MYVKRQHSGLDPQQAQGVALDHRFDFLDAQRALPGKLGPDSSSLGEVYRANGTNAAASNKYTVVLKRLKDHKPSGFIVYTSYPNP